MTVEYEKVKDGHLLIDLRGKTDDSHKQLALFFQEFICLVATRCLREKIVKEDGITRDTGKSSRWLTEKLPNRFACIFDSTLSDDSFFDRKDVLPLEKEVGECLEYGRIRTFYLYVLSANFSLMYKGECSFEISFHRGSDWNDPDPFMHTAVEKVLKKEM